jgi:acylphosphatase
MSDDNNFESDEIITLHLNITGRVQGVGYRDSLRMIAQALNVTGWVRNKEDGSVEAIVQGEEQDVERVVAWCHKINRGLSRFRGCRTHSQLFENLDFHKTKTLAPERLNKHLCPERLTYRRFSIL